MWRKQFVYTNVFILALTLNGQNVIVNEMSQGSGGGKEWVELLVVENGTDLRGWELGDNDDGIWHSLVEFSTHPVWSSMAEGTLIVIYNSGDVDETILAAGGEDTDFADKSVIIAVNNTSYFIDTGIWGGTSGAFANTDGDDCAAIRDTADIIIHDMALTHPTAVITAPGSAKVKYFSADSVGDIGDDSKWVEAPSSEATPGQGNGGDNSTWIDSSLPIELAIWSGYCSEGKVHLQWTTESELENQGFIITRREKESERFIELSSFVHNAQLIGHGSTTDRHNYTFADTDVEPGQDYVYQLADVDYDNRMTTHSELFIHIGSLDLEIDQSPVDLDPPFPNPFNSTVQLSFRLEQEAEMLTLNLYDTRGDLVRSLAEGAYPKGTYQFHWEGSKEGGGLLASGVYILRLLIGEHQYVQRITYLR
ncbi:MAG: hypothetical protein K9N35_11280 [Candidatus Marinimicrobia bacterium]|nr:hypothetical protein [Candidatus Neomarinimicrobiota bacterium]